jgi:hypothetical protein
VTAVHTPSHPQILDQPSRVSPEAARDFLAQVEKTLTTRRLYAAHMAPYRDAFQRLATKLETVLEGGELTIQVGRNELRLENATVFQREAAEDCWFYPLYRDGVRELVFRWPPEAEELESFLTVLEADRRGLLGPAEDTVVLLWRSDLEAISYSAMDGLGDEEGEDAGTRGESEGGVSDEFRALVQEVMAMIEAPSSPVTGQRYAFHLDADVRISAADLEYDPSAVRRAFEEGPRILPLTPLEADGLRAEAKSDDGAALVERFVEILISLLTDPRDVVPVDRVAPVLEQLAEGYWTIGELAELVELCASLDEGRRLAARPEARQALERILQSFAKPDRVARTLELVARGDLSLAQALELWRDDTDERWVDLLDFVAVLPEGSPRREVVSHLRRRLADRPELMARALASDDPQRIHAALALLDQRVERLFADEILSLVDHPDQQVRLKAVAAAGRLGGEEALELLWSVIESDPEQSVRLLAFRSMSVCGLGSPHLEGRLMGLIGDPSFQSRAPWEQSKYVRLLGRIAPQTAMPLFESWLPSGRLSWARRGESSPELALTGLAQCGAAGLGRLRQLARSGGRLGRMAAEALANSLEER